MKISSRLKKIKASATVAVAKRAKQLSREGKDVLNFAMSEPDFNTPKIVSDEAKKAIDQGMTHYTMSTGIPELREAICNRTMVDHELEYDPDQVIVTCGAKFALFNAFMAILDPGDEVIIFSPFWVSYPEQVKLAGGTPVIVETNYKTHYQIDEALLRKAVGGKTRIIVINSPSNPTGAILNEDSLKLVARIAEEKNLWIISDEIYEKLVYERPTPTSIAAYSPDLKERTIIVNGVAKSCAMTGWRIGYSIATPELTAAMAKIQGQTITHPSSIAQHAATRAFNSMTDFLPEMIAIFDKRRRFMYEEMVKLPGIELNPPEGAFYLFPSFAKLIDSSEFANDIDFCTQLLEKHFVATTPGTAFGAPGHIRLSYAASFDNLREGLGRLSEFVKEIGSP